MDTSYKLEKNMLNYCNDYIDKCNNWEIINPKETIYNACFDYLNGTASKKVMELLELWFEIENTPTIN